MTHSVIVWLRHDLRLEDNPALYEASKLDIPMVPIYIWSPEEEKPWVSQGAALWRLQASIKAMSGQIEKLGSQLIVQEGDSLEVLLNVSRKVKAKYVFWNRRYEPQIIRRDKKIKKALTDNEIFAKSFNGSLLFEPWEILNKEGNYYKVFTSFWKACLKNQNPRQPYPSIKKIPASIKKLKSVWPKHFDQVSKEKWVKKIEGYCQVGEKSSKSILTKFLEEKINKYDIQRDFPNEIATSNLSAALHFGEISPHKIFYDVLKKNKKSSKSDPFLRQLIWRDFSYSILFHNPNFPQKSYKSEFLNYSWKKNKKFLKLWQQGKTGYPMVDAGMRELWQTGSMHNRLRMITASFLTKNLNVPWQEGAKWFWSTLVDADLANNSFGWQWVAGCGLDAAPFFRIFNPVLQGKKFDPQGNYIKRYVPELKKLPEKWIHEPWTAPDEVLKQAKIKLGKDYPKLIVDLKETREEALKNYKNLNRHCTI